MSDGTYEFVVPDLGEGLEEATVVEWHVQLGAPVALNAPLVTVETAKAEVEIPSPRAGVLVDRRGEPGETLAVGTMLARIADAGTEGDRQEPPVDPHGRGGRRPLLVGYGVMDDDGTPPTTPAPPGRPVAGPCEPAWPRPGTGVLAKPPVRHLAHSLGVDLAGLSPGSGPGGIVTRADVEAAAGGDLEPVRSRPRSDTAPGAAVVPLTGVRAQVAARMAASRAAIPDATCSVEVDAGALCSLRDAWRADLPGVTPFGILCRLLVDVLSRHPFLNATFVDRGPAVHTFPWVHLGIGTATERGLVVPVVRDAHLLSTDALVARIGSLTEQARAGSLAPAASHGSTFTVSNYGAFGIDDGIPVINPPEAGVLGVGAIKDRPSVVDGVVVVRPTVRLTLVFDHRVADGAHAGAFLGELRQLIEAPARALLHASPAAGPPDVAGLSAGPGGPHPAPGSGPR